MLILCPKEIVDPAEHHGLDKVRLSYDFQEISCTVDISRCRLNGSQ